MIDNISPEYMSNLILSKLSHNFGVSETEATDEQIFKAIALIINELLLQKRAEFVSEIKKQNKKQVCYICMEFLMGRSLKNNLFNLGLEKTMRLALKKININLDRIYSQEPDAALGNGGLGRLAACFLDTMASQDYPEIGYSLKYEYGIFRQKLIDGWQSEAPDFWLPKGNVWLERQPEKAIEVLFDGEVEESWENSYHQVKIKNATKVLAIPCDMLIPGFRSKGVSKLRLFEAKSLDFNIDLFNSGEYIRAMEQNAMAEAITKLLYPEDNHPEGKSLRLSQQYFLVSATVQDIVRRHLERNTSLNNLHENYVIHLNDTHPILAIPELMRIMLDECGYTWETAFDIVSKTFAYTNHTVMPEALECWSVELLKRRLPRIYQIIDEINKRFCQQMRDKEIDEEKINQMAIINSGVIRMANLGVICCYCVNGVSKLHTEILKNKIFKNFYIINPDKFKSITNGIAHRRWLNQSNPELASFITELIGDEYVSDASKLKDLLNFKDDISVLSSINKIKYNNKVRLSNLIKNNSGIIVNPDSIFDIQIKRLHEYKRQHMNALNILSTYLWLKENKNAPFVPKTYIFGAKAAPGYYFAKQIIKFISTIGSVINNDPDVNDKLKVIFMEDYKVTLAEILIPAAEISEQISLAGKEASGTGNMKLMLNGAITLGTLDGANIEIKNAVGDENIIIFGMDANEVNSLRNSGYNPSIYYNNSQTIKDAIDCMRSGFYNIRFDDIANSLLYQDPYMVLADFSDYSMAQKKASKLYSDRISWGRKSLYNIANAGYFSGDRTICDYAKNIWHIEPINNQ